MSAEYLLDTNAAIALLNGDAVLGSKLAGEVEIYLPVPVAGELYFGAAKSARVSENTNKVSAFVAANMLVGCDRGTALNYGQLKTN